MHQLCRRREAAAAILLLALGLHLSVPNHALPGQDFEGVPSFPYGHGAAGGAPAYYQGPVNYDDPCAVAAMAATGPERRLFPLDKALKCQKSFPFNLSVAESILDALDWSMQFYVYRDIARCSPDPRIPSHVFLPEGLQSIRGRAVAGMYATEFDFEIALYNLYQTLNDINMYYRPNCFLRWRYVHGFSLMGVAEQGRLKIKLAPAQYQNLAILKLSAPRLRLSDFEGREIVAIDGVPALEYMERFANQTRVGMFKDPRTRLNAALFSVSLNSTGNQTFVTGAFTEWTLPPSKPTITFTFAKQQSIGGYGQTENSGYGTDSVTLRFYAYYRGPPFQSQSGYFRLNCAPVNPDGGAQQGPSVQDSDMNYAMASGEIRWAEMQQRPQPLSPTAEVLSADVLSTFVLKEHNVGVIAIPTLRSNGGDSELGFFGRFLNSLAVGVEQLKSKCVERVIIDLSNNQGGYRGLANWVVNALFPHRVVLLPTRVRANPVAQQAVDIANRRNLRSSFYHWSNWASVEDDHPPFMSLNSGFFFPVENITYGGVESSWSQPFVDKYPHPLIPSVFVRPFGRTPPFRAENIIILSNGVCASSCATMASMLTQFYGVHTVTVGGIPGLPQQIGSGYGQSAGVYEFRKQVPLAPPEPPPRSTVTSFPERAYSGGAQLPPGVRRNAIPSLLEYVYQPSTLPSQPASTSQEAVWADVAKLF